MAISSELIKQLTQDIDTCLVLMRIASSKAMTVEQKREIFRIQDEFLSVILKLWEMIGESFTQPKRISP